MQAKVTSKGQVTLPKPLRTQLSIRSGDRLEFSLEKPDRISVRKKRAPGSSAGCGRRFLKKETPAVSVEEMDKAIGRAIRKKQSASKPQK